jgi:hypothetical protein
MARRLPASGKDLRGNLKKVKNPVRSKIMKHGTTKGTFVVA